MKRKVLSTIGRLLAGVLLVTCLPLQSFATNSSPDTAVVTNGRLVFNGTFDVTVFSGEHDAPNEGGVASTLTGTIVYDGLSEIEGAEFYKPNNYNDIYLPGYYFLSEYNGDMFKWGPVSTDYSGFSVTLTESSRSIYNLNDIDLRNNGSFNDGYVLEVTGHVSGTLEDGTVVELDLDDFNLWQCDWTSSDKDSLLPMRGGHFAGTNLTHPETESDEPEPGTPEYFIAEYNESTETAAENIKELAKTVTSSTVVEFKGGDALPQNIMTEVKSSDKITLEFPFTYEGVNYRCKVTPAKAKLYVKDDIPWYGPLYLMQYFDVTRE